MVRINISRYKNGDTELSNKTVGKTKTLQLVSKECSSMTVGRYKNGD